MQEKRQFAETSMFKASILFLALSVFAWGLGAKLSLYSVPQPSSVVSVAKMSTDKRSAHTVTIVSLAENQTPSRFDGGTSYPVLCDGLVVSWKGIRQAEIALYMPFRAQLRGPNYRRPPPSLLS